MTSNIVVNSVIGGILVSISYSIFQWTHDLPLQINNIFWDMTTLYPKNLPHYMPVVSGIFFTSGILFDCFQYEGLGGLSLFGDQVDILKKTSMYGYSLGGFAIGLGSYLADGDEVTHSLIGIASGRWFSVIILLLMIGSSFFWSFIVRNYLPILNDSIINPQMNNIHILSANITIGISIVLIIVAICLYRSKNYSIKATAKKIMGSFFSGCLISLGFGICSLSTRLTFLIGITPSTDWSPNFIVFLVTGITASSIIRKIILETPLEKEEVGQREQQKQNRQKILSKTKRCIGALLYGLGLGIVGLNISTFLIQSSIFTIPVIIIFGGFLILGNMIGDAISD